MGQMFRAVTLGSPEEKNSAQGLVSIPVLVPNPAEDKDVLFYLSPSDHPWKQRLITSLILLPPKIRAIVINALLEGKVEPQDMSYQSMAEVRTSTAEQTIKVVSSDLPKNRMRNFDKGKLDAGRLFFMAGTRFLYGLSDNTDLLGYTADFGLIQDSNAAPGTEKFLQQQAPTVLKNGLFNFVQDNTYYQDEMGGQEYYFNPFGNQPSLHEMVCPKFIYPQMDIKCWVETTAGFAPPEGKKAWLMFVMYGIELRLGNLWAN